MQRYEQLTVADTVQALTEAMYQPTQYLKAQKAVVTVETAGLRFLTDGNNPTTTRGHELGTGDVVELNSPDEIKKFRAIRTGGTSSSIHVTYLFENDR